MSATKRLLDDVEDKLTTDEDRERMALDDEPPEELECIYCHKMMKIDFRHPERPCEHCGVG